MSRRRGQVAILGTGRAGGALAVLLTRAEWPVRALWSRRRHRARTIAGRVLRAGGCAPQCVAKPRQALDAANIIVLAVPDPALADLAGALAESGKPLEKLTVLHISGAMGLEPLAPVRKCGASVGSLHPMQVFSLAAPAVNLLRGAGCAIDGDPAARRLAAAMARDLGAMSYRIPNAGRSGYHLAASMVANDTMALFHLAHQEMTAAGVSDTAARKALAHLLQGAAATLSREPVARALTGPVIRGDAETIRAHLHSATNPASRDIHARLSTIIVHLARHSGRLDATATRRLQRLLKTTHQSGS